jgi:four helix bundle protein
MTGEGFFIANRSSNLLAACSSSATCHALSSFKISTAWAGMDRLEDYQMTVNGASILQQYFTYDKSHNITAVTEGTKTKTYDYDANNQLIRSITPGEFVEPNATSGTYGLKTGDYLGAAAVNFAPTTTAMLGLDYNSSSIGIDFGTIVEKGKGKREKGKNNGTNWSLVMKNDLPERTFEFAGRIIELCGLLDMKPGVLRTLCNQLLRSGTSIGANVQEGQASQSEADFLSKYNIACKEARETQYWLKLLMATELVSKDQVMDIYNESCELVAILTVIVKKLKIKRDNK